MLRVMLNALPEASLMKLPDRSLLLLVLACLLAACASSGGKRVSTPAASIQQLEIDARGQWQLQLRLQNYSSLAMRFDKVSLALEVAGQKAGQLDAEPALSISPESADVIRIVLVPDAAARLEAADALAGGRSLAYRLQGQMTATPENGKPRVFEIRRESALSPAPGLPGILR